MADGFTVTLETDALVAALLDLGDFAQPFINDAARESAESIAHEARGRLQRQLGPQSTGETVAGIEALRARTGNGYVVIAGNRRMPALPRWIERGTRRGKARGSTQAARPFFAVSVSLEQGAHRRRIADAVQAAITAKGLGV